jgi:serine phosphatase RsbU (regulator of sigma subunit)
MFGDERLAAIVAREAGGGAENVRDAVVSEVARFREGAQQDDLTLLVARFR